MRATLLLIVTLVAAPLLIPATALTPALPGCADRPAPLPPCNLWASRPPTGPANEVHVAVDPTDPQHLLAVAKDYSLGTWNGCRPGGAYHVGSASYVSFDGGASWSVARVPGPYPNGGAEPSPLPYSCGSDPVAMFGPDGTAYYLLLNFDYVGTRHGAIAVARSADGGLTWPASDIRVLHTASGDDKEWGAVSQAGTVHVVWTDVGTGRIHYTRSLPGWTFEAPRILANAGGGNPAVVVDTGPANEVVVLWRDSGSLKLRVSLDDGATFAPTRTALATAPWESGGAPRLPFMPQMAIDDSPTSPFSGSIYVTWPASGAGADVRLAYSRDMGATWSPQIRVSDDPGAKNQVMPTVSVAPNGRVDVAWLDQRLSPNADVWTAFVSRSADGGATWSANRAVQEVPLYEEWSRHQDGSVFIGDYMGIASTDAFAYPIFPGNGLDRIEELGASGMQRADAYVAAVPSAAISPAAAPWLEGPFMPSLPAEHRMPRVMAPHE